jgi:flagellar hook-associated protein 3 FlgL
MRVSSLTLQQGTVANMLRQQAALARTQNEIASGKKLMSPADDPAGATRVLDLERTRVASEQFAANSSMAKNRLSFEEQALADVGDLLQRVRELALQANNGVLDDASRKMVGAELRLRVQEVADIANRQDGSGEYLFSGFRSATKPFTRTPTGIAYNGDSGTRSVQIGVTQSVQDSHTGYETFMDIPSGNGTFTTTANAANTGTGVIDVGSVTSASAWVADTYTVHFTSGTAYEVLDSANVVVTTGTYTPDGAISFRGVQMSVSGTPATNDRFTVAPSVREDLFTSLDRLLTVVDGSTQSPQLRAQFATSMGGMLQQLSQGMDHLLNVRAEVGARLSAVDTADSVRGSLDVELQKTISEIRDVDYATVLTRMNTQLVNLQAAQQSYAKMSQLTLFDYL